MKLLISLAATLLLFVASPATPLSTVPLTMEMIVSDADDIFFGKVVSGICTSDKCGDKGNNSSIVYVVNCSLWIHGFCYEQQLLRSQKIMQPQQGGYFVHNQMCVGCNYLIFISPEKRKDSIHLFKLTENNSRVIAENSIKPFKGLRLQRHVDSYFPEQSYNFYNTDDVLAEIKRIKGGTRQ